MTVLGIILSLFSLTQIVDQKHVRNDTIVNAVQIRHDKFTNTWNIAWLNSFKRIRITVESISGNDLVDQTFENTDNGDLQLAMLTPGFYLIHIQTDNEIPVHLYILQEDYSKGFRDD